MAKCSNCSAEAHHIVINSRGERCEHCGDFAVTAGSTDRVHARGIFSIRTSSQEYEGDTIPPYVVDKNSGRQVINPDFIERFPDQAFNYYTEEQLKEQGLTKLADKAESDRAEAQAGQDEEDVTYSGELTEQDIKEIPNARS